MSVSYQLYSSRNFTPWSNVIETLAELGYTQVEGFAAVYDDPVTFRQLLDENGLSMPSGHFSIEALEDDFDATVAQARLLGVQKIFAPYLGEEDRACDTAGWTDFASRLSAIGDKLRNAGFGFGWHNHDFEFSPLEDGGIPMRILLESDSALEWEADIAWVIRGGADPFEWIETYGHRITAAHVKDIAPDGQNADEDGWSDLGRGIVDWAGLTASLRSKGVTLFIMEHDNPSDDARFARNSIETFKSF
ncbi:MAG: sugar phosphate isomerase/epimerase family protein [Ruegeria sp.]